MFKHSLLVSSVFSLLLFSTAVDIKAQKTPQQDKEFPIGAFIGSKDEKIRHGTDAWNSVDTSGMNTFIQYADDITQTHLENYNAIGLNNDFPQDKIYWYALGYYSIWQVENPGDISRTGFVHKFGHSANWNGVDCWTNDTTSPACSLLYGPHYKQDKDWKDFGTRIQYTARYWLALDYDSALVDPNIEICKLIVTERYTKIINGSWDGHVYVDKIDSLILKASDFYGSAGNFKNFDITYHYPTKFKDKLIEKLNIILPDTVYCDIDADNGIEFKLDFLVGNNHIRHLFADKIEVFDTRIWVDYMDNPNGISDIIKAYAFSYKNSGKWDNMINWYATDEPRGFDNYLPMHIVDSILASINCPHIITEMYPPWQTVINGDTLLKKYVEIAQPDPLMIDSFPFIPPDGQSNNKEFEYLRKKFAIAHSLQPGFWYVGQGFGEQDLVDTTIWHTWRKPTSSELKASVMLALAHGVKGLLFWNYWSYPGNDFATDIFYNCLVDTNYHPTSLWYLIKNNLAPRLKGTLGNTLKNLDYTGLFTHIIQDPIPPEGPYPSSIDYLALSSDEILYNFYAGLLKQNNTLDNKYFLLTNLRTDFNLFVTFTITNNFGVNNVKIKYVENPSILDTTINNYLTKEIPISPGEGYLFQVAPVVKYGGKLYYPETINDNTTLYDDMIIENGVTLTVNGTYTCYGNIYLKTNAKIQTTGNGNIKLENGKSIFVQGAATLTGTEDHILTITSDTDSNAVTVYSLVGLTVNYCHFVNGRNGIKVSGGANSFIVNNSAFDNLNNAGILILGNMVNLPKIKWCSFINSTSGIQAMGLSSIIIQDNNFTDNVYDIKLSQVSGAQIIANTIENNYYNGQGILLTSCSSGYIRRNSISGHINGIYLANSSSPNIGANVIWNNEKNGIYVGTGSQPDLRGYLVQLPCHTPPLYYALRGYNTIFENGIDINGNTEGSEIYLSYSNVLMNVPCNQVSDDRTPGMESLIKNLISGRLYNPGSQILDVSYQSWGNNPYYRLRERFGLRVDFDPYYEVCPMIDYIDCPFITYATDGTVIDTLYPEGEEHNLLDPIDEQLKTADAYYNEGNYSSAEAVYTDIVNNYPDIQKAVKAYTQLYAIKKLTDSTGTNFSELKSFLESKLPEISDSLIMKIVSQLSTLCYVGNSEYVPAINTFDEIVQQNPNTEEGLYAEIDALTTAIISYNQGGGGLQKGLPGKYKAGSEEELIDRLNNLMRNNFEDNSKKKGIIPTEYSLYNNYPNPFNPTTTIRFDIPERTNAELSVYNILGQKVKTLIANETKNPGRYEVSFNGSSLASGVYVYRLITKNYAQSRKMLLIK